MNCPKCRVGMEKTAGRYQYLECGLDNVWLEECKIYACARCHARIPVLPDAKRAARLIARFVVTQKERLGDDVILFLRKTMGLTAAGLAELIGVNRVEVSRWENERARIDPYHEFRLRMNAISRLLPEKEQAKIHGKVSSMFGFLDFPKMSAAKHAIRVTARQLVGA